MNCGWPVAEAPPQGERWRLFIAIPLPDAQQAVLRAAVARLRQSVDAPVRWGAENAHLTLRFLGETKDGRSEAVAAALGERAAPLAAFPLHIAGAGCFPPRGPVQVAWAGVAGDLPALTALHQAAEGAAVAAGFAPERRPFAPHLTLGRARGRLTPAQGAAVRNALAGLPLPQTPFTVREAVLYRSELRPEGAVHTALAHAPLNG
jgi:2'-5' RNA ligase